MEKLWSVFQYIRHRIRSRRWDSFHSPYLFELFSYCCNTRNNSPLFAAIENERAQLRKSKQHIPRQDFGAGSIWSDIKEKQKVTIISKHALSFPFQCRFLFRLVQYTEAKTIVEFGTSLGISASYLGAANKDSKVITIEGDAGIAAIAQTIFDALQLENITLINSTFEEFLVRKNTIPDEMDIIFLDGNHRSEALLRYYHALRPFMKTSTIVVVDDIYWSKDMQVAWRQLIAMEEVTQSVDCFHFGILFFRNDFLNPEHHWIRISG